MRFELDEVNLKHFVEDHPERLISPEKLYEIAAHDPKVLDNVPKEGRTGSHLLIAPDDAGRYWRLAAIHVYKDVWRPITGWPSTRAEIRRAQEADPWSA